VRIAEVFGLVILLCDGILQVVVVEAAGEDDIDLHRKRFFGMVRRLPMELQMVLCNRLHESHRNSVLTKNSEPAFRAILSYFDSKKKT